MPARRSRTLQWRRSLEELVEREGSLDIAVARDYPDESAGTHLIWRVRLLAFDDGEIMVEHPLAFGQEIPLDPGSALVGIIAIGQNRWSFRSEVLGGGQRPDRRGRPTTVLRLRMPTGVDRCQRRDYYRMSTAALNLPQIELWPLLDPASTMLAERANEIAVEAERNGAASGGHAVTELPEVGPAFGATILNIGGGGLGAVVSPEAAGVLVRHRVFWCRLALGPELRTPICATVRLAHTHLQSDQMTYAGFAFDFSANPGHQRFVVEQICRFIALQQKAADERRRSA